MFALPTFALAGHRMNAGGIAMLFTSFIPYYITILCAIQRVY